MKKLIIVFAVLFLMTTPAFAGFKEGEEAYNKGDYVAALHELRPLAEEGDAQAQYHLGIMYAGGLGVRKDYAETVQWFKKAAKQGFTKAQNDIGVMYYIGYGVPKDYVLSYMWLNIANVNQDNKAARELLNDLEKAMTPAQIAEAQRLSREFKVDKKN
ncbi:hypothetical protein MNBD_DELTA01-1995 [hydrothermal vent metagenome]|uniref:TETRATRICOPEPTIDE REPEAT FAMILY PROTEIN n=1 Tax=hydrothermal vent metagenome TaxID=652676 RepID=A0A3B0QT88_9ZZZZ